MKKQQKTNRVTSAGTEADNEQMLIAHSSSQTCSNTNVMRSAFSVRYDAVSELYNMDCIQGMKHYPDKWFDLAIVDPPYGIDDKLQFHETGTTKNKMYGKKRWDIAKINEEYLVELFRVSKDIIFWGGNYYSNLLPNSRGWIFWQKFSHNNLKYSHGELAWTSFDRKLEMFKCYVDGISLKSPVIHPTQKPIMLYEFCLEYSKLKKGQRVLDTHVGSGSSRIACYLNGFEFVGFEIDKQYCEASEKRFVNAISQQRMSF